MKYRIYTLSIFLFLIGTLNNAYSGPTKSDTMDQQEKPSPKVLRHMVLFKFKNTAPEKEVQKLNKAFNALQSAIPAIKNFEWGINDSPENFHQGFTHCYLVSFESEEDRDLVYTPHPDHQDFVASLQPFLEKVFVVDYWALP